jgi:hypothetical protein
MGMKNHPDRIWAWYDTEYEVVSGGLKKFPFDLASEYVRADLVDPVAIREAALREAAAVAEALAFKWWSEYKDRLSPHCADPQYQGMSDGADDVANAILALIGDKK